MISKSIISEKHLLAFKRMAWPLLVTLIFIFFAFLFSANIPFHDDYKVIIEYLLNSEQGAVNGLFDWWVSHRPVFARLLAKLSMVFGGGVNLRFVLVLNALFLVGVVALIWHSVKDHEHRNFVLLPLCLSVFSLYHWTALMWATAASQFYGLLLFAVLSFYLFSKKHLLAKAGGLFCGFVAIYAAGNGLLILPMLFLWSVVSWRNRDGERISVGMTLCCAVVCAISLYLFFAIPPAREINIDGMRGMLQFSDERSGRSLWTLLVHYLTASAGYISFNRTIGAFVGLLVNLYFVILIWFRYYKVNGVVFYTYLFALSSIALVALFRGNIGYVDGHLAYRYQIYTILLNPLIVISFLELNFISFFRSYRISRYFKRATIWFFVLVYLISIDNFSRAENRKEGTVRNLRTWHTTGDLTLDWRPDVEYASDTLKRAIDAGIYTIPPEISQTTD